MKEQNKKKNIYIEILEYALLAIYAVVVIFLATKHECYEDECQSWLIARDLGPVGIILQMKYEGHSFIWYYIIAPFAKLGFPVVTQSYISCIFGIGTSYLILKKSPFNIFFKILFIFNGGLIYLYSVIARPYCMIPFLLAYISVIYENRDKHPVKYGICLALLANTHLVMLPIAVLLLMENVVIEFNKKINGKYIGYTIAFIGIVNILIATLLGKMYCKITSANNKIDNITSVKSALRLVRYTFEDSISMMYGNNSIPAYFTLMIGIALLLCLFGSVLNIKQGILFFSQLLFTFLIHLMTWFILPTRIYIIIFTLMFWLWNYKCDKIIIDKKLGKIFKHNYFVEAAAIIIILFSSTSMYKLAKQDIHGQFSMGKETANYICENISENSVFICADTELQQSLIAYLGDKNYKFYMPNSKKYITYITWDEYWLRGIEYEELNQAVNDLSKEYDSIYIITNDLVLMPGLEFKNSFFYSLMRSYYVRDDSFTIYRVDLGGLQ